MDLVEERSYAPEEEEHRYRLAGHIGAEEPGLERDAGRQQRLVIDGLEQLVPFRRGVGRRFDRALAMALVEGDRLDDPVDLSLDDRRDKIGRAACRERVCQDV